MRIKLFLLLLGTCLLGACKAAPPQQNAVPLKPEGTGWTGFGIMRSDSTDYEVVEIFYGTDRRATGSDDEEDYFLGERGDLTYGRLRVSIPKQHRTGVLDSPPFWAPDWLPLFGKNPGDHIVLLSIEPLLNESLTGARKSRDTAALVRDALVFIHGFNTSFEDAARRCAQITYDLKFPGVPALFSWPSEGTWSPLAYTADEADARWTVPHLAEFLAVVAERSGAHRVHILAHSMGTRALTAALRIALNRDSLRFNQVILAAPDIDAAEFRRDIGPAIVGAAERITLYASSNDRALAFSRVVHDNQMAGEGGQNIVLLDGIDTIDASELDPDLLGHSYFSEVPSVIDDLFKLLRHRLGPDERRLESRQRGNARYWLLPP